MYNLSFPILEFDCYVRETLLKPENQSNFVEWFLLNIHGMKKKENDIFIIDKLFFNPEIVEMTAYQNGHGFIFSVPMLDVLNYIKERDIADNKECILKTTCLKDFNEFAKEVIDWVYNNEIMILKEILKLKGYNQYEIMSVKLNADKIYISCLHYNGYTESFEFDLSCVFR